MNNTSCAATTFRSVVVNTYKLQETVKTKGDHHQKKTDKTLKKTKRKKKNHTKR